MSKIHLRVKGNSVISCLLFVFGFIFVRSESCLAQNIRSEGIVRAVPGYQVVPLGRGHGNQLCLAATVEGTKGLMTVNTSLPFTALREDKFKYLLSNANCASQLKQNGLPTTYTLHESERCPLAIAHNFVVSNVNLGEAIVCLRERRLLYSTAGDRQYDGQMGKNFFLRNRAVIDCGRLVLCLNTNPALRHDFGPALIHGGWTRIPMTVVNEVFTVPCMVDNHEFSVFVDTGDSLTHLSHNMLLAAGARLDNPGVADYKPIGISGFGYLQLNNFRVGNYVAIKAESLVATKIDTAYMPQDTHAVGYLADDFLASNNAVIDVGNLALYLKR